MPITDPSPIDRTLAAVVAVVVVTVVMVVMVAAVTTVVITLLLFPPRFQKIYKLPISMETYNSGGVKGFF